MMCARGRLSPAKLTRHSETDLASGSRPGWPGSPIAVLAGRLGCRSDWLAPPPFFLLTPRPRSLVPLSYPHNAGGSVPGTERTYDVGSARPENDARSQTPTHALWRRESGHGNPLGISWHRKRPTRAACTDFSPLFTCSNTIQAVAEDDRRPFPKPRVAGSSPAGGAILQGRDTSGAPAEKLAGCS